jgi:uncharacterized protein YhdP
MKYRHYALFCFGLVLFAGCQHGSSTAPSTAPSAAPNANNNSANPPRKLTVTSPGSQTIRQDKTDEMTVSISRSHFASPVKVEIRHLPAGVTVDTKDLTIPADKTSLTLTLKAAPDAKSVDNQKVTLAAKATNEKDMEEATVDFDLSVKPK